MIPPAAQLVSAAPLPVAAATRAMDARPAEVEFLPVLTLVLWTGCLAVGALGLSLSYARPQPPAQEPPPVQAELLQVELTNDPLSPLDAPPPPPGTPQPPPLPELIVTTPVPPLLTVAAPSPVIAFALPVEGPARIVEAKQAAYTRPAEPVVAPPAPAVQAITYGQGEGKQPAPDYPSRARREGQEGAVVIRFSVSEDGRVLAAEVFVPSAWPLLNREAVRVVREQWRLRPGPARLCEVSIRFELLK
jgi:protein TonB